MLAMDSSADWSALLRSRAGQEKRTRRTKCNSNAHTSTQIDTIQAHTWAFHSSILSSIFSNLPVFGKQRSKLYCVFVPVRQPFNGVFDFLLVRVAQLSKCLSCPCF